MRERHSTVFYCHFLVASYLVRQFSSLKSTTYAASFVEDVDFSLFPAYCTVVGYPVCLSRIIERLERGFYRRLEVSMTEPDFD
jgi:hypothetical protein